MDPLIIAATRPSTLTEPSDEEYVAAHRGPLPALRREIRRCRLVSYLPGPDPIATLTNRYLWYRSRGC